MQFKYPELLYALFLLLIPILIHLFQLRRFEKVPFTNVDFLKKIELQTRKSSKLKKFLILLSRMLFLACLILAFAQPYFSKHTKGQKTQTIVYLDNSLSMQAKNGSISLLELAKQQLITELNKQKTTISVLTNSDFYTNLDKKELKNTILSISYNPITKPIDNILQRANFLFEKNKKTRKNIILISDFQKATIHKIDSNKIYSLVQLKPDKATNYAVDSVSIKKETVDKITLNTYISSSKKSDNPVAYALYDTNKLLGKTSVSFKEKTTQNRNFTIPKKQGLNGKITTTDNQLLFDNSLFFAIDKPKKIAVLAIGEKADYLSKIYTKDQFDLTLAKANQIDYNQISKQNTLILNELDKIDLSLQKILTEFVNKGGYLVIIPSDKINIKSYNQLFNQLKIGHISNKKERELQISKINFSHPVLKGVFEKHIQNFQYPNVKLYYEGAFNHTSGILKFENQTNFISQIKHKKGSVFWLASPINNKVSNFKNSPLIVPVFYNIAAQSIYLDKLYYRIGDNNTIDVKTKIKKDAVIKIQEKGNPKNSFIPLQQVLYDKIRLELDSYPLKAGFYEIVYNNKTLKNIAFNYSREENKLKYTDLSYLKKYNNIQVFNKVSNVFKQLREETKNTNYWKIMLLFALVFLFIEMLLIKFWKN